MTNLRLPLILLSLMLMFLAAVVPAQTNSKSKIKPATEKYFIGKWKSIIMGVPQGDTEVTIEFVKKDGRLTGSLIEPKQNVVTEFRDIKIVSGILTLMFTSQGYDVSLSLQKKDQDNFTGTMMDQFAVTGTRLK